MSQNNLNRESISKRDGQEPIHDAGNPTGKTLQSFWEWSLSDLLNNTTRGILAEYIVALGLGIDLSHPRQDWDTVDLTTSNGVTIEVKASAYLQSWHQEKPSKIEFGIAPKRSWDPVTNFYSDKPTRHAEVYIFALMTSQDISLADPLDLSRWSFYVVPTETLNIQMEERKSISLNQLELIASPVSYADLKSEFHTRTESIQD